VRRGIAAVAVEEARIFALRHSAGLRAHPKAPYLRLVVSHDSPAFLHFGTGDLLQKMFDVIRRWRAANSEDYSRFI